MARRSPGEVYAALIQAGFLPDQATVLTAIAGAESGWNDSAVGDVGLQNATWGPSFGLFQIRTLKAATGTGGTRDINALTGNVLAQARAAYTISRGGTDFSPWTVYTTGAYQQYLQAARNAAGEQDDNGPFPTVGPDWLPWNWPSLAGNAVVGGAEDAAAGVLGGARHIVIETLFVLGGIALVGAGAVIIATGTTRRVVRRGRSAVGL